MVRTQDSYSRGLGSNPDKMLGNLPVALGTSNFITVIETGFEHQLDN